MLEGDVRIVGVSLLRNEEYFAAWALMNAAAFCDRIIVMDNRSQDRTRRIVETVAGIHPHVEIMDVRHPRRTHKYLEPLAGTPTWVFCIDGDEIHDPAGLAVMRKRLLSGEYGNHWSLQGHFVHAVAVCSEEERAFGYSQPLSVGGDRLFNCQAIESWSDGTERLHAGRIVFRPGYDRTTLHLWKRETWNESVFRCLHLCFMPRSSLDASGELAGGEFGRKNPAELYKERFIYQRLRRAVRRRFKAGVDEVRDYKQRQYAQGPVGDFDISGFGLPSDFRAVDPDCDEAMTVLRASTERRRGGTGGAHTGRPGISRLPVYVINLDGRPDRWAFMSEQCDRLGIEATRIPAVDAELLAKRPAADVRKQGRRLKEWRGGLNPGALACAYSHLKALQAFQESGEPAALILEDDAELADDTPGLLESVDWWPAGTHIVRLEDSVLPSPRWYRAAPLWRSSGKTPSGRELHRLERWIPGAAAYLINRRGADIAIPAFADPYYPADHILFDLRYDMTARRLQTLQIMPAMARQYETPGSSLGNLGAWSDTYKLKGRARRLYKLRRNLHALPYKIRVLTLRAMRKVRKQRIEYSATPPGG